MIKLKECDVSSITEMSEDVLPKVDEPREFLIQLRGAIRKRMVQINDNKPDNFDVLQSLGEAKSLSWVHDKINNYIFFGT